MFGIGKLRERISSLELELGVQKIKHLEHVILSNQRHKKAMRLAGYEPIKDLINKNWDGKECHKPFGVISEDGKRYEIRSDTKNGYLRYRIYKDGILEVVWIVPQIVYGNFDIGMPNKQDKQFSDDEYFKEVGK